MNSAIELSLFVSRLEAICSEMGVVLRRSAFSPNIKDRLDFSCALFDARGRLCAQAAHIPVHLGSMAFAMEQLVQAFAWQAGDTVILNDPFKGGTHLPDVTLITPAFDDTGALLGFVVNRAHHANIGADTPGSMPNASRLEEEGLLLSPQYLVRAGQVNAPLCAELAQALGLPPPAADRLPDGDFTAQYSANQVGLRRLLALAARQGNAALRQSLDALQDYGAVLSHKALQALPHGSWQFADCMDDDGQGNSDIRIALTLSIDEQGMTADFTGTSPQVRGNINCPLAVTAAAVFYVLRCLLPAQAPTCAGLFWPLKLVAEPGSLVHAHYPAAVAAGNVETSMRIVDVMLGALHQALPERIPAASQGTMNNVAMGARPANGVAWDYYETLAGGGGAGPAQPGMDAAHSHMTNTLNTPVESLELHYPLRVRRYALRQGSGGAGRHGGGAGLVRDYEFLEPTVVSLLTERRRYAPWGVAGGAAGQPGENRLNGKPLPAKTSFEASAGDVLSIATPGGGGWGSVDPQSPG